MLPDEVPKNTRSLGTLAPRDLRGLVVLALGGARQRLAVLLVRVVRQARAVVGVRTGGAVPVGVPLLGGGRTQGLRPYRSGRTGTGRHDQHDPSRKRGGQGDGGELLHGASPWIPRFFWMFAMEFLANYQLIPSGLKRTGMPAFLARSTQSAVPWEGCSPGGHQGLFFRHGFAHAMTSWAPALT